MEITHTLTYNNVTTAIDEPIGFDDLKMTLKRHEYHGIGAEVSAGELEFYGQAYTIIMQAYDADIDAEVVYGVTAGTDVLYSGKVDLSTCRVLEGEYRSVSAKVGEIGTKTTFNNRLNSDIDISSPKTVDGASVTSPDWLSLHIPMKHLLYTNKLQQKLDKTLIEKQVWGVATDVGGLQDNFVLDDVTANEFGIVATDGMLFVKDEDFDTKYGTGTEVNITSRFVVEFSWTEVTWLVPPPYPREPEFIGSVTLYSGTTTLGGADFYRVTGQKILRAVLSPILSSAIPTDAIRVEYQIGLSEYAVLGFLGMKLTLKAQSFFTMTMYDNLTETDPVSADMILVHDALNVVAKGISENTISVKSDWYRTPASKWNAGAAGGGACKALTNGYKIRGLFTDANNKRNMPMSFKTLIEALDAQDCIGWGFATESGALCVRVERWDWFYKNATVITLTDVAEVTTEVNTDLIPTELKIGYKKYATSDEYNSIDSPHGTRTFNSGIKAVTKSLTRECDFVADNYAIEETRRAKKGKNETEETTYDETIFLFELVMLQVQPSLPATFTIVHSAIDPQNVGRASEFINAKLTPRHMAARWRDYLFAANSSMPFRFTAGEINYNASFKTAPENSTTPLANATFLQSFAVTAPQVENDDITFVAALFKAESIKFSCPLTIEQYEAIKTSPYGLVSVNGKLGWIREFSYSFHDGMADFTLIAKR